MGNFHTFWLELLDELDHLVDMIQVLPVHHEVHSERNRELANFLSKCNFVGMALGAREGDVLRLVISGGLKLVLIGMVIGLAAGFALTRWLSTLLFGVSPANPLVYLAVAAGMIAIALVACYLPARSAMKVDPMQALRAE